MTPSAPPSRPAPDPEPIPLQATQEPLPFPVDAFPGPIASMIAEVAEATQTDPAMAGTTALTVLAAAVCGHVEVEARPGWREVLALHTATIASPGERKSAVQSAMTAPLWSVEDELETQVAAARTHASTLAEIASKRVEKLKADAGRAGTRAQEKKLTEEALVAAQEASEITVPAVPRLVADDATPEAIASLLAEQGGRLAIISSEGGLFDTIAGRYSSGVSNLDVVLKGHDGDPIRVDRRGRAAERIHRPALTIGLMVQPSVIEELGRRGEFRGRGLLGRFLYAWPPSRVGHRKADPQPVRSTTRARYTATVEELARDLYGTSSDDQVLHLTPDAEKLLIERQEALEPLMGQAEQLASIADWASKLNGRVVRIAALLHLAAGGASSTSTPITRTELAAAVRLGDYFLADAIRTFSAMQIDPDTADAVYLLDRLRQHDGEEVSARDLLRLARRFKKKTDLDAPVQRLLDHGWLIEGEAPEYSGVGRRPDPRYRLHPNIHADQRLHAA